MKIISKGCFGVCKQIEIDKTVYKVWIARGTKAECVSYLIELANDCYKFGWCSDVQLSLHVFPLNNNVCFNIIKYDKKDLKQILRIEYHIARYKEKLKVKVSTKYSKTL